MTNKKGIKRTLFASALSLLLCISMLIGSTFAWFTDSVTSANNKIQAGTLKIDLSVLNEAGTSFDSVKENKDPIFNYDKWEPGYVDVKILKVENKGNLALKWYAKFVSDAALSKLAEVIDVYVYPSATELDYPTDFDSIENDYQYVGTVADFVNTISTTTYGTLEEGTSAYLGIALKMRESAGNDYQGLSLGAFDIQILATQFTSENDQFGPDYDKDSTYPALIKVVAPVADTGDTVITYTNQNNAISDLEIKIPEDALDTATETIVVEIKEEKEVHSGVSVNAGETGTTYDIDVSGIAAGNTEAITVKLNIGTGLSNVKIYHNDTLIPSTYNETTGILEFETTSFSPYTVIHDVVSSEVSTADELKAAIAMGGKVILKNDISFTGTIEITKDVTLDLAGHTLETSANKARAFKITTSNVKFVIDAVGGTLTFGGGTYGVIELPNGVSGTKVTINGGTFTGTTDKGAFIKFRSVDYNTVTLNGVTYTDNCPAADSPSSKTNAWTVASESTGKGNKLIVNGGSYTSFAGFIVNSSLELVANSATINNKGAVCEIAASKATIDNCDITLDPGYYVYSADGAVSVSYNGILNISNSAISSGSYGLYVLPTGGTIYADDCEINAPLGNRIDDYTKGKIYINGFILVSSESAINAAIADGEENITLNNDITFNELVFVPEGNTVVLDLNNCTITTNDYCAIKNEGVLTIKGNGTINGSYTALYSRCMITIENGSFNATEGFGLLLDNYDRTEDSVAIINGGTFTGVGIYNPTDVTINGGTFNLGKDPDGWALTNYPEYVAVLIRPDATRIPPTSDVVINGGTFNGDILIYDDEFTEVNLENNGANVTGEIIFVE